MLTAAFNPDGSVKVAFLRPTDCLGVVRDMRSAGVAVTHPHFTAEGVAFVVEHNDGIRYEVSIKPILRRGIKTSPMVHPVTKE